MKNGFTLIELLAVISILAIILLIAVPNIITTLTNTKSSTFKSQVQLIIDAIEQKQAENINFDPTTLTQDNIDDILGIDNSSLSTVSITMPSGVITVDIKGTGKWSDLEVTGTSKNLNVTTATIVYDYGTSIQSTYTNIYSTDYPSGVTSTWATGTYAGNYKIASWRGCSDGYNGTLTELMTYTNGKVNILSGTNTYNLSTLSANNRWLRIILFSAYLTSSVEISNFKLIFNDSNSYTLTEAVTNGYIEPLVVISSGYNQTGVSYYWPNIMNITGTTTTGLRSYTSAIIYLKIKNISPLSAVTFYTNKAWHTTQDGLSVDQFSEGFEYYLSKS